MTDPTPADKTPIFIKLPEEETKAVREKGPDAAFDSLLEWTRDTFSATHNEKPQKYAARAEARDKIAAIKNAKSVSGRPTLTPNTSFNAENVPRSESMQKRAGSDLFKTPAKRSSTTRTNDAGQANPKLECYR